VKILLDTHVFLWHINGTGNHSESAQSTIRDPNYSVFLSVASLWECVIKNSIGKIQFPGNPAEYLAGQALAHRIDLLAIDEGTICHLPQLPSIHRDPFDRIIVCQALQHEMTIITVDEKLQAYPVPILS
jgi:PIN domain nuclease of toxin-antitoxin system